MINCTINGTRIYIHVGDLIQTLETVWENSKVDINPCLQLEFTKTFEFSLTFLCLHQENVNKMLLNQANKMQ